MRLILRVDNNSICHATHKTKILFVQQIPPPLPLHAVSLTVITSCSVARSSPHTATSTPVCPYHEIREIRDRFVFLEPSEVMRELCLPKKRKTAIRNVPVMAALFSVQNPFSFRRIRPSVAPQEARQAAKIRVVHIHIHWSY